MIKKVISKICMLTGFLCIVFSAFLFVNNEKKENELEISTNDILVEIFDTINTTNENDKTTLENQNLVSPQENEDEILIDDNVFSFVLNIPSLNLSFPIQKNWSYDNLNISPCIYKSEPLSIAAHNYKNQFGKLSKLKVGEIVTIDYFNGQTEEFVVVSVTKIHETDIEKLNDLNYDLSLFTCNYPNNSERILVRLNKVNKK